ncbi:amino acid adenylation domain-containing protein [Micromonospora sp. NPDC049282]|uniref:amino acid adenylation domain-containing protein n=1 Tax=Micromonospora sp. NPDC049282 TaxID=3364269 RepID=UPI003713C4CC
MTTFVSDLPDHDGPALVTPEGRVSYRELRRRSGSLARVLTGRGIGPERVCVVALEHGADRIVAVIAALRAGAAFLVVDTDLPDRRVQALSRGAHATITSPALAPRLAALGLPAPAVLLDDTAPEVPLPAGVEPRTLAYVSHTSGSTGTPNAVLIEHRWMHPYLRGIVRDYVLGPDTVAVQLAPPGFDAALRDTFAPLIAGGRLVVLPRSTLLRPAEFFAALAAYHVNTMLSVTPSFLSFLANQPGAAAALGGLRLVATTGEPIRPFLVAGGRQLVPGRLINQYGPTECTMTTTRFEVPREPDTSRDVIGVPVDGTAVRLVTADIEPVAAGAAGEICIAGPGVARGYADRPALTAERFVPDPEGPAGARMYRTGDLARWRPDGTLEYLGRRDHQIKIRGYRIDPGEVEGTLLTHPAVTGAAITASADEQGRTHLVAHLTGALSDVADGALRTHLAQTLPPHMIPRRFHRRDHLPTTRTGKVDRLALASAPDAPDHPEGTRR